MASKKKLESFYLNVLFFMSQKCLQFESEFRSLNIKLRTFIGKECSKCFMVPFLSGCIFIAGILIGYSVMEREMNAF